ncbi:MAG: hypothetical protein NTV71_00425, partial [Candidatus Omnitrophica bacterium]|nr:hypothetical protein [Candidatus Omnitrophota bacterium]
AKVNDLQAQLTNSATQANDQVALVSSLQNSLNKVTAELEKIKTAYSDLESKLKEQVPVDMFQPVVN